MRKANELYTDKVQQDKTTGCSVGIDVTGWKYDAVVSSDPTPDRPGLVLKSKNVVKTVHHFMV